MGIQKKKDLRDFVLWQPVPTLPHCPQGGGSTGEHQPAAAAPPLPPGCKTTQ